MSVYSKLAKVQCTLKCNKGQYNSFGHYKYRSCEDILEAVKPQLAANRAAIILSDEVVTVGDRFYVKATAKFIDTETGEVATNTAYAREDETKKGMDGSQITGTSSSYARKYALNGLLCIDDTKDADTDEMHNQQNRDEKPAAVQAAEKAFNAQAVEVQSADYVKVEGGIYKLMSKKNGHWYTFDQLSAKGPELLNGLMNDKDYAVAHNAIHNYLASKQW